MSSRLPLQVIALTTAIGVVRGTNSEAFALGLVFSLVVSQGLLHDTHDAESDAEADAEVCMA